MKLARNLLTATALTIAVIGIANAEVIVNYQVTNYGGAEPGTFSGADLNLDSILSFSELTSFQFDNPSLGHHVDLAGLAGFGDFNYITNIWTPNGFGWDEYNSFFSWNQGTNSVHGTWASVSTTVVSSNNIPEPAPLALIGITLAWLAFSRRRTLPPT